MERRASVHRYRQTPNAERRTPNTSALRAAFTLVELLVVVFIIVVVMGAAVAGLSGFSSGTNRLLAAEQLTADLVRQARHTAASTGIPAVIRITQIRDELDGISRVSGGEISGLDSALLYEQRFEGERKPDGSEDDIWQDARIQDANGHTIPVQGRTGHGLAITLNGTTLQWPSDVKKLKETFAESPAERLVRSTTAKPGFMLSASVWVPAITDTNPPYHIPVALIGTDDAPTIDTSLAGLMLRKHTRPLQIKKRNDADNNSVDKAETLTTWEILGWIGDGKNTQTWVSSCDDTALNTSDLQTTADWNGTGFSALTSPGTVNSTTVTDPLTNRDLWNTLARDIAAPLTGERWVDLSLQYDGDALRLWCDGAVIGILRRSSTTAFPELPADDLHDTIWYGVATLSSSLNAAYVSRTGVASDRTCYATSAILDDVRLVRLGTGPAAPLPNGLRPWISGSDTAWYQITAMPDGRTLTAIMQPNGSAVTATTAQTLTFAEAGDPMFVISATNQPSLWVDIKIDLSGTVTSAIKRLQTASDGSMHTVTP